MLGGAYTGDPSPPDRPIHVCCVEESGHTTGMFTRWPLYLMKMHEIHGRVQECVSSGGGGGGGRCSGSTTQHIILRYFPKVMVLKKFSYLVLGRFPPVPPLIIKGALIRGRMTSGNNMVLAKNTTGQALVDM